MEIYDRDKKYFSDCQKRFTEWYNKHSQPRTKSKVAESSQKYYYNTIQVINKLMTGFYIQMNNDTCSTMRLLILEI